MWLDPRNGPAWDLAAEPTTRPYVIASTPRTGSTLLCRLLWETGLVGAPAEYCNPMQVRDWCLRTGSWRERAAARLWRGPLLPLAGRGWGPGRRAAHLAAVQERRTGPGGHFGLKIHAHHARRWLGPHLERVPELLGAPRWVRIRRADLDGQAISWVRALQSGRWTATQREAVRPRFDRRALELAADRIRHHEAWWDARLAPRVVLELDYAELIAAPEPTVRRALDWLGVADASRVAIGPMPLARQADALSAAWRRRWRGG